MGDKIDLESLGKVLGGVDIEKAVETVKEAESTIEGVVDQAEKVSALDGLTKSDAWKKLKDGLDTVENIADKVDGGSSKTKTTTTKK